MLNPEVTRAMKIRELAAALENQMREFGYSQSSLKTYRCIFARIVRYIEEQGVERFNMDLGQKFIVEYGGEHYGAKGTFKNYCRAVRMLSDLQQHGMIFKQTLWPKKEFSSGFRIIFGAVHSLPALVVQAQNGGHHAAALTAFQRGGYFLLIELTTESLHRCDELWAFGPCVSSGMQAEIAEAERLRIPVRRMDVSEELIPERTLSVTLCG